MSTSFSPNPPDRRVPWRFRSRGNHGRSGKTGRLTQQEPLFPNQKMGKLSFGIMRNLKETSQSFIHKKNKSSAEKKSMLAKTYYLSFFWGMVTRCSLQTRWDFQQNVLDWEQSLGPFGTPKPPFWRLTFRPVYSDVNCHSN